MLLAMRRASSSVSALATWEALPDFCENVPNCVLAEKAALACNLSAMRRFPAPWSVEALDGGFKIMDANGQSLAYVYGHADPRDAQVAKALTLDEARRIASNIAKLPKLRQVNLCTAIGAGIFGLAVAPRLTAKANPLSATR